MGIFEKMQQLTKAKNEELEAEVKLLQESLASGQMLFNISES